MDGVVRAPSAFSITLGALPSMTATQLLVVPRSIPMTLAIACLFLSEPRWNPETPAVPQPSPVGHGSLLSFVTRPPAGLRGLYRRGFPGLQAFGPVPADREAGAMSAIPVPQCARRSPDAGGARRPPVMAATASPREPLPDTRISRTACPGGGLNL